MQNKRFIGKQIDAKLLPKDENGNTCCRFCGKAVLPPRRTMCSPECAHEIAIRNKLFLSHTYDHRIIDGALGGKFAQKIGYYIENFDLKSDINT